jgi:hypothetical protein
MPLKPDARAGALTDELFEIGAQLLVGVLPLYAAGELQPQPQDEAKHLLPTPAQGRRSGSIGRTRTSYSNASFALTIHGRERLQRGMANQLRSVQHAWILTGSDRRQPGPSLMERNYASLLEAAH